MNDQIQNPVNMDANSPEMAIASKNQRIGNYFLDLVFIYIFSFAMGLILYFIGLGDIIANINTTLFGLILFLLYYVPQEAFFGWTFGKLITGTRVVSEDGTPVSFVQVVGRTFSRFIPFEAFSFLGKRNHPVGWHDKFPKTRVISIK